MGEWVGDKFQSVPSMYTAFYIPHEDANVPPSPDGLLHALEPLPNRYVYIRPLPPFEIFVQRRRRVEGLSYNKHMASMKVPGE